mmetsp:Transcript_14969/g.37695  ORF Transcript_14969/g.37695 Transcript_14969/m.37695 type:complete len:116 (-) Transcript_14969:69-416(-)
MKTKKLNTQAIETIRMNEACGQSPPCHFEKKLIEPRETMLKQSIQFLASFTSRSGSQKNKASHQHCKQNTPKRTKTIDNRKMRIQYKSHQIDRRQADTVICPFSHHTRPTRIQIS